MPVGECAGVLPPPPPTQAAAFAVAKTNQLLDGLDCGETTLAVHLCRRAGGRARGEHSHDGPIRRILPHINQLEVGHLTVECTTPGQAAEIADLAELRPDFEIGFGCVSCAPGCVDSVETIVER